MAISGKTGEVLGSGANIRSWVLTLTTDLLDSSHMGGGGYREYVAGLQGAGGVVTMTQRWSEGSPREITLTNDLNEYKLTAIFNNETVTTAVDGLVLYVHSFTATGSIAVT